MQDIEILLEKQKKLINCLILSGKDDYKYKADVNLSPIGWHLLHCLYVECIWIRELFLNDNNLKKELEKTADGINIPTIKRGNNLPEFKTLLKLCSKEFNNNINFVKDIQDKRISNKRATIKYIVKFLINHHCQHLETIKIILNLKNLYYPKFADEKLKVITPENYKFKSVFFKSDTYYLGTDNKFFSFDNEQPRHKTFIKNFSISKKLITIAEWLGFICDNGYNRKELWSLRGWSWKNKNNITKPLNWYMSDNKLSLCSPDGYIQPKKNKPVTNISFFELQAFAVWKKLKVPHEFEWEISYKKFIDKNLVWEWCSNFFFPYKNFSPFPYSDYSVPWFNKEYYTMKGSSVYSEKEIKRATFRNFYQPNNRYIFSGGRLSNK